MKRSILVVIPLALSMPAFGQDRSKEVGDRRAMYEDIEIMRNLLARQLHTVQQTQCTVCHADAKAHSGLQLNDFSGRIGAGFADFDGDGKLDLYVANHPHGGGTAPTSIEGSYLKGQGVVFQVTMPPVPPNEMAASAAGQTQKAVSDWEKARRQMRGEKTDSGPAARRTTLADLMLQALADNGKNFSKLPETESVTLVFTFRASSPAAGGSGMMMSGGMASAGGSGMGGMGMAGMGSSMVGPASAGGAGASIGGPMGGGTASAPMGGEGGGPESMTPDRELELLGDLHQKRGNWNDAISAYERALGKARESANKPERVRQLVRKLAEIHLNSGNFEAARKALESASAAEPKKAPEKAPVQVVPAIKIPARLIVSANKKLLDQAGDGKISFAEFQKLASLEVLNLSDASTPKK
jgi:tetratricopeptide (TPR) repeat protein